MNNNDKDLLHSWVMTTWGGVFKGRGEGDTAKKARNELLVRYHEAVYHYFLAKIRDPNAAHELYSNFAVKLIETDRILKNADPDRGRFRHYLKAALHHMVIDYYRSRVRGEQARRINFDPAEHDVIDPKEGERDGDFSPIWRQELLNQAWKALQAPGAANRPAAQHRAALPVGQPRRQGRRSSPNSLSAKLGKPFSHDAVRRRCTGRGRSSPRCCWRKWSGRWMSPTLDELEAELIDQQLLPYCKKALEERRAPPSNGSAESPAGEAPAACSGLKLRWSPANPSPSRSRMTSKQLG